jgi:hypothetical protein
MEGSQLVTRQFSNLTVNNLIPGYRAVGVKALNSTSSSSIIYNEKKSSCYYTYISVSVIQ